MGNKQAKENQEASTEVPPTEDPTPREETASPGATPSKDLNPSEYATSAGEASQEANPTDEGSQEANPTDEGSQEANPTDEGSQEANPTAEGSQEAITTQVASRKASPMEDTSQGAPPTEEASRAETVPEKAASNEATHAASNDTTRIDKIRDAFKKSTQSVEKAPEKGAPLESDAAHKGGKKVKKTFKEKCAIWKMALNGIGRTDEMLGKLGVTDVTSSCDEEKPAAAFIEALERDIIQNDAIRHLFPQVHQFIGGNITHYYENNKGELIKKLKRFRRDLLVIIKEEKEKIAEDVWETYKQNYEKIIGSDVSIHDVPRMAVWKTRQVVRIRKFQKKLEKMLGKLNTNTERISTLERNKKRTGPQGDVWIQEAREANQKLVPQIEEIKRVIQFHTELDEEINAAIKKATDTADNADGTNTDTGTGTGTNATDDADGIEKGVCIEFDTTCDTPVTIPGPNNIVTNRSVDRRRLGILESAEPSLPYATCSLAGVAMLLGSYVIYRFLRVWSKRNERASPMINYRLS